MVHPEVLNGQESPPSELRASFLRSAVPVAATYASAAIGLALFGGGPLPALAVPPAVGVAVVVLFTLTHAVLPVFFYRRFLDTLGQFALAADAGGANFIVRGMRGFVSLHMALWFGLPLLVLSYFTGWLSLLWAACHVALARHGRRAWVYLEYGSTSLAMLLFLVCFSGARLFPWGLVVVAIQSLLLTILDWKARAQWTQAAIAL